MTFIWFKGEPRITLSVRTRFTKPGVVGSIPDLEEDDGFKELDICNRT